MIAAVAAAALSERRRRLAHSRLLAVCASPLSAPRAPWSPGTVVVCPYCIGQWVVGGLTLGMIGAPRLTRVLTGMYAAETVSDAPQLAYVAGKQHV